MAKFLMFYAPFLVVILGLVLAFWWVPKDHHIEDKSRK
ncbi:cytochrome bd oxidase small subunit CydS [Lysinibacillus piscis]|uniref:Uncharacterized protein n=1 Tax=Lysinibacillus piscis TaxID=2518931 RepID=A0ABQ5NQ80_9BACI|nr:hypothetical protein LYSBPC_35850 [Lysinibacillus sp. KH24]